MKKCPFCKAEIEENARFCLYCMKPLNEKEVILPSKKRRWWPAPAAILLLAVILALFLLPPREKPDKTGDKTVGSQPAQPQGKEENPDGETPPDNNDQLPDPDGETPPDNNDQTPDSDDNLAENQNPEQDPNGGADDPDVQEPEPEDPDGEKDTPSQPPETEEDPPAKTQVVYTYRAARAGDDFNANYQNAGNDIVITGIAQVSDDGVYDIPAYIDGKKVIAICSLAFNGSGATTIYVPDTVKTIWNYAFSGCGLTELYFRGQAVYMEHSTFTGSVTIHCSATCSDRNFRYYESSAASYGATWAEWNG